MGASSPHNYIIATQSENTMFDTKDYIEQIVKNMPQGYTLSEDILDSAYGTTKRLFGADTARLLFYYEEGFENDLIKAYCVA